MEVLVDTTVAIRLATAPAHIPVNTGATVARTINRSAMTQPQNPAPQMQDQQPEIIIPVSTTVATVAWSAPAPHHVKTMATVVMTIMIIARVQQKHLQLSLPVGTTVVIILEAVPAPAPVNTTATVAMTTMRYAMAQPQTPSPQLQIQLLQQPEVGVPVDTAVVLMPVVAPAPHPVDTMAIAVMTTMIIARAQRTKLVQPQRLPVGTTVVSILEGVPAPAPVNTMATVAMTTTRTAPPPHQNQQSQGLTPPVEETCMALGPSQVHTIQNITMTTPTVSGIYRPPLAKGSLCHLLTWSWRTAALVITSLCTMDRLCNLKC